MRVLVVTVVHVPGDARIRHRQIAALLDAGHEVTYVAPHRPPQLDGSDVAGLTRVPVPPAVGRDRVDALLAARRVLGAHGPGHDLVLLHDPELLASLPGLDLPPIVWDVHEDLAGSFADKAWLPVWVRAPAATAVRLAERMAESRVHLLLAEHAYQERFARLHPVVPNLPPLPAEAGPAATRDAVVHLGRVSWLRGARELVAVGSRLAPHDITLHLVGPVDPEVRPVVEAAARRGELVAHGFVPNDVALPMLDGAIAGLALLHDHPNYRVSLPTKVVEYLAAGIPAITTPLPEAVRPVTGADAGAVVGFGDVAAVVTQVLAWHEDRDEARRVGRRGRRAAEDRWSWAAVAPRFVAQLESWAGVGSAVRRGTGRQ